MVLIGVRDTIITITVVTDKNNKYDEAQQLTLTTLKKKAFKFTKFSIGLSFIVTDAFSYLMTVILFENHQHTFAFLG